jgi:hypothetical protein
MRAALDRTVQIQLLVCANGNDEKTCRVLDCGNGFAISDHAVLTARHVLRKRLGELSHFQIVFQQRGAARQSVRFAKPSELPPTSTTRIEGLHDEHVLAAYDLAVLVLPEGDSLPFAAGTEPTIALAPADLAFEHRDAWLTFLIDESKCPLPDANIRPGHAAHAVELGTIETVPGGSNVSKKVRLNIAEQGGYSGAPVSLPDGSLVGTYTGSKAEKTPKGRVSLLLDDGNLRSILGGPGIGARMRPLYRRWRRRGLIGLQLVWDLIGSVDVTGDFARAPGKWAKPDGFFVSYRPELWLGPAYDHGRALGLLFSLGYLNSKHGSAFSDPLGRDFESSANVDAKTLSGEVGASSSFGRNASASMLLEGGARLRLGSMGPVDSDERSHFFSYGPTLRPGVRFSFPSGASLLMAMPVMLEWLNLPRYRYTGSGADYGLQDTHTVSFSTVVELGVEYGVERAARSH